MRSISIKMILSRIGLKACSKARGRCADYGLIYSGDLFCQGCFETERLLCVCVSECEWERECVKAWFTRGSTSLRNLCLHAAYIWETSCVEAPAIYIWPQLEKWGQISLGMSCDYSWTFAICSNLFGLLQRGRIFAQLFHIFLILICFMGMASQ